MSISVYHIAHDRYTQKPLPKAQSVRSNSISSAVL